MSDRIVVTGGAGALGRVIAAGFVDDGAKVELVDSSDAVGAVAAELGCVAHLADVTDETALTDLAGAGPVRCLVNAAGRWPITPFRELDLDTWNGVIASNLTGAMLTTRVLLEDLRAGEGCVVNLSSATAFSGGPPGLTAYVAAKAGLIGLTRSLARELGAWRIRVNAVAPGFVDTPGNRAAMPEEAFGRAVAARALGRPLVPDDVVGAVLFLASPAAALVTGQILVVDGGAIFH
jgi:NAD(P)-dependent dehydrogenase (short-subunit alcohol dehydrogenase family)